MQDVLSGAPVPPALTSASLLQRAQALARSGRAAAARPLLAAARRLGGDDDAIDALDADLLLLAGRATEAVQVLDAAIARTADGRELRLTRARARLVLGDAAGAATDAADAVVATPGSPAAQAALGLALAELGHCNEAEPCLSAAIAGDPSQANWRIALARMRTALCDAPGAETALADGIAHLPTNLALRREAVRAARDRGDLAKAAALARAACRVGILDAAILSMLGEALTGLRHDAAAGEAFGEAYKLAPQDVRLRHLAAAAGHLPAADHAPDDFIRALFERVADQYETDIERVGGGGLKLASMLARRPPAWPDAGARIVDLGCGTGRVARALSPYIRGAWFGIDLSPSMLRHASGSGTYRAVHEAPIDTALAAPGPPFDAAFAVDSLRFRGPLEAIFAAVWRRLRPHGRFVATFDALPDDGPWQLRPGGAYGHAAGYVGHAADTVGFAVAAQLTDTGTDGTNRLGVLLTRPN